MNGPMDEASADLLKDIFLEGIVAPDFSLKALSALKRKKNLRILKWPNMLSSPLPLHSLSEIHGGFLLQTRDELKNPKNWNCMTGSIPEEIQPDLQFAWKLCAHLKSNAIAIVKQGQSLGLGMGQVSRVDAVKLALERAKKFHPEKKDLILASDAFFPFPDSIRMAAQGGVSWIIQPGGSINDKMILQTARELKINMIFTGERHFKH